MGTKLATLLSTDHEVTVWNRTRSKITAGIDARIAETASEAIGSSETIIICVHDYKAVNEVLSQVTVHDTFRDKVVINFTTIGPDESTALQTVVHDNGGQFVNGALQVAPDQMGLPGTTIFLSGDRPAFETARPILLLLGGNLSYFGEKVSDASVADLASLTWFYGAYLGMIHAVALCRKTGFSLADFGNLLPQVAPDFIAFMQHQVQAIEHNNFAVNQSPLSISVTAATRIAGTLQTQGLYSEMWQGISALFSEAVNMNLVDQELASIIQVVGKERVAA